jgi:hypothetical protein
VEFVNGKGTANQAGAEQWGVDGDELPHSGVVVGEDLQLGVKVEVQVDEACECSSGVARRHGLESVVDLGLVARADAAVVHDLAVAITDLNGVDGRLADEEEVRAETWWLLVTAVIVK